MNTNIINKESEIYTFLQKTQYEVYNKTRIKYEFGENIDEIDYLIITESCIYAFQDKWTRLYTQDKINNFIDNIFLLNNIINQKSNINIPIYAIYLLKSKISILNQKQIDKYKNNIMIKFFIIDNVSKISLLFNNIMKIFYLSEHRLFIYDDESCVMFIE